jgi:molybdopterin converting factor subunit 1
MAESVKVLAFAGARDVIGEAEVDMPLEAEATAEQLMDAICRRYPGLEPYRSAIRMAVNGAYVSWDEAVRPGDEVALIPPVAGG